MRVIGDIGIRRTGTAPTPIITAESIRSSVLRVPWSEDDTHIATLIATAVERLESHTGLSCGVKTWEQTMHAFPIPTPTSPMAPIEFLRGPLVTVETLKYLDDVDAEQDYAVATDARVVTGQLPGCLVPKMGNQWPIITLPRPGAVKVAFTAGYTLADLPAQFRQAVCLLVAHWFENREDAVVGTIVAELPQGVRDLVASLKVRFLF